ncbi:MAG: hypothetical protein V2I43_27280 [Parvularcula sp.]|jgi:hypothetical protein|nr:hypothetical protein [Parvularcula sp.]
MTNGIKPRRDGSPLSNIDGRPIDPDVIAQKLNRASYASQQAFQLLQIVFDHDQVSSDGRLCTLIAACMDYLEEGDDAIGAVWPVIGFRSDGETPAAHSD